VQKAKTILALDNKSEGISHQIYFTTWLAFVLKTSIAGQGYGICKKKMSGAGGI
jgi:hypothetical protein